MSIFQNNNNNYYRTSNFYAACFLFSKGQTLVNIDKKIDSKRAQFVFLDSPEMECLLHGFNYSKENSPEATVDSRIFVTAIRRLKEKLYEGGKI